MPKELSVYNSWMNGINSHTSALQAFRKLPGKQYVRQFALIVSLAFIIRLFAIQICRIDFPTRMSQTGKVDYPTGRRFLEKNGHWHDVANSGIWCTFSVFNNNLVSWKWPRWLTPSCISKPSLVTARGQRITPALLISICSSFCSRLNLQEFARTIYIDDDEIGQYLLGRKLPNRIQRC